MTVITLDGQVGAGGPEVGARIARSLGLDYIERLALRDAASSLGASVESVVRKESGFGTLRSRLRGLAELWLSQIGWYAYSIDPMQLPTGNTDGLYPIPGGRDADTDKDRKAAQVLSAPRSEISDREFTGAVRHVTRRLAEQGDLVLVKRGGCVTLREDPDVIHIGLFAPYEARVERLSRRLGVGIAEADEQLWKLEQSRAGYFKRLGGAHPHDRGLYDVVINTGLRANYNDAAYRISSAIKEMAA